MSGTAGVRFLSVLKITTQHAKFPGRIRRPNRNVAGLVEQEWKRTEKVKAVILVML
jgi:hypothetical protein